MVLGENFDEGEGAEVGKGAASLEHLAGVEVSGFKCRGVHLLAVVVGRVLGHVPSELRHLLEVSGFHHRAVRGFRWCRIPGYDLTKSALHKAPRLIA